MVIQLVRFFLYAILSLCIFPAQGQNLIFQRPLGGSARDVGKDIGVTHDGKLIVCGFVESNDGDVSGNHGFVDGWIGKLDNTGSLEWQKCFGGIDVDAFSCLDVNSGGEIILGGGLSSIDTNYSCGGSGNVDFWLLKIDSVGNVLWDRCYGGTSSDEINDIIFTSDGGILAFGSTESTDGDVVGNHASCNGCSSDFWMLKLDSNGNIIWSKCFGSPLSESTFSVIEVSPGFYVACGGTYSTGGDVSQTFGLLDYWVILVDSFGSLVWEKTLGGSSNDVAEGLAVTSDGSILVVGEAASANGHITNPFGGPDAWLVKLSISGSIIWEKSFGGSSFDAGVSVVVQNTDNIAILARSNSNDGHVSNNHGDDFLLIICDSAGNFIESKCYGGSGADEPYQLIAYENGFAAIGYTDSFDGDVQGNHGPVNCGFLECLDIWVIKVVPTLNTINSIDTLESKVKCSYNKESSSIFVEWFNYGDGETQIIVTNPLGAILKNISYPVLIGENRIEISLQPNESSIIFITLVNSRINQTDKLFIY